MDAIARLYPDCVMRALQAQEQALKQLSFLKNGTEYPDRSVLDGFTEDNLRTRIGEHLCIMKQAVSIWQSA